MLDQYVSKVVRYQVAEWNFTSVVSGVQFAMMIGIQTMRGWCADSLAFHELPEP